MFITFEGLDFCGKSTQIKLLEECLIDEGERVRIIREPGGVSISEKIRDILLDNNNSEMCSESELLLFSASRAQLVRELIIPALEGGEIVMSDRFHDSSIAYQGYGRGINKDFVIDLQSFAIGSAVPDLTFFIDIPVSEVVRRKQLAVHQELDRIEVSENDFYERVRSGYKSLAQNEERFITIDGLMTINEIHIEIKNAVQSYRGK